MGHSIKIDIPIFGSRPSPLERSIASKDAVVVLPDTDEAHQSLFALFVKILRSLMIDDRTIKEQAILFPAWTFGIQPLVRCPTFDPKNQTRSEPDDIVCPVVSSRIRVSIAQRSIELNKFHADQGSGHAIFHQTFKMIEDPDGRKEIPLFFAIGKSGMQISVLVVLVTPPAKILPRIHSVAIKRRTHNRASMPGFVQHAVVLVTNFIS